MVEQIRVALQATDPLSRTGLSDYLRSHPDVALVDQSERGDATILVSSCGRLTTEVVAMLRWNAARFDTPVVLVAGDITGDEMITAIDCRVVAVLPRDAVTAEMLLHTLRLVAKGGGVMPPNLVGDLLRTFARLKHDVLGPNGLNSAGLSTREIEVLRLMADGLDTNEIAVELSYSERTVKNVIYGLTNRLKLRNRSHAVAYAMRAGMI